MTDQPQANAHEDAGRDRAGAVIRDLRELSAELQAVTTRFAQQVDLRASDFRALSIVRLRADDPPTMSEIATELAVTSGAVTGIVDRLERAGYVERVRDEQDRRRTYLRATAAADELAETFYGALARRLHEAIAGLSDRDLRAVQRFLHAVVPAIATFALPEHGRGGGKDGQGD